MALFCSWGEVMKRTLFDTLEILQIGAIRQFLTGMVLVGAVVAPLVVYALME